MITKCLRSRMKGRRVQHQAREKGVEEGTLPLVRLVF
jgi:hypothetical protein